MRPTAPLVAILCGVASIAIATPPARAVCISARLFSSGLAYVVTPGCEATACGSDASSVTDDFDGAFWALGEGDPPVGAGIDNGAFAARGGWLVQYTGYPALINSTWAASTAIDGCIDFAADPGRCMAILLTDRHPMLGDGVFALLVRSADALGNYDFDPGWDITLAPLPRPDVVATYVIDPNHIGFTVDGIGPDEVAAGLTLDPECTSAMPPVAGYRLYARIQPLFDPPPSDANADLWLPVTDVVPLGELVNFTVNCEELDAMWIRSGLVFDSGYDNPFLSEQTPRIECYRGLAEPGDPQPRKPRNRERPRNRESRH